MRFAFLLSSALVVVALCACPAPSPPSVPTLSGDVLRDPQSCQGCHAAAFESWQASGHANAATSPLFVALLARAEREESSETAQRCLSCHAPHVGTARANELTTLPNSVRGVTCFSCHGVDDVTEEHSGGLRYPEAGAERLFGRAPSTAEAPHSLTPSSRLDRTRSASNSLCIACHQGAPDALPVEDTGNQFQASVFADSSTGTSCAGCHLVESNHRAFTSDNADAFRALDYTVSPELCVEGIGGGVELTVRLENFGSAHHFPSGGAHRKRAWVEVVATRGEAILFAKGDFDDDTAVDAIADADPELWTLHTKLKDDDNNEVSFEWNATSLDNDGLVAAAGLSPLDPAYEDVHQTRTYFFVGPSPDRVTLRVRYRAVNHALIDSLVDSGDLRTGDIVVETKALKGSEVEWTEGLGQRCVPSPRR